MNRLVPFLIGWFIDPPSHSAALPGNTKVYCAHEYTQSNARFCLSRPNTPPALLARAQEITRLRDSNVPTVPTTVQLELDTNPFLMAATVEEFAELRKAKDSF
jgi:hydroxyacylglutathione hydrolase